MCDFCPETQGVEQKKKYKACHTCRTASKKAGQGSGLFYDSINKQYVDGDALPAVVVARALVLDLHNVTDLLSVPEFIEHVGPLKDKYDHVVLLSYVGTTTDTRTGAETQMREFHEGLPWIHGYLCFKRGAAVATGNKGDFIGRLQAIHVDFLDDHEDHIAAGRESGAVSHLIPHGPTAKQHVVQLLEALLHA